MGRRKELGSIASGIAGSFSSRNNDDAGYWGIGKLCSFANKKGVECVVLDLLKNETIPKTRKFKKMLENYSLILKMQCDKRKIPIEWLSKVTITVCFNQDYERKLHYYRSTYGEPFVCIMRITDDLGRERFSRTGNWCAPHDPKIESCSARA